jgi:peptidyl-prolyl cis-trans isomerase SurA
MTSMLQVGLISTCHVVLMMTPKFISTPATFVFGTLLLVVPTLAPAQSTTTQSPYGGVPVEEIIARVNDQIITLSDYNRALKESDDEARQRGATTMQEINASHKDLLRDLIDQQLWLSKGKELGITEETELVKKLDEIRKQYHLASIDDLAKAAEEQGVSFEDFKASIRNSLITQEVMREEVGSKITITPGEAERYYEQHKSDYTQPESERLSEILISAGKQGAAGEEVSDPAKLAAALAKANDIEAKLHAGGDFAQLARSFSDGPTAAQGGDLGQYQRGQLAAELEAKTFPLKAGQYTAPIRTRQGYVILKVTEHNPGGPAPYNDVKDKVQDAYFMTRMEPAIRAYLTKMRDEAFIDIAPGYVDTGASPNETKPIFSAYTPPAPKKRKKLERTRFRESTHSFRQKSRPTEEDAEAAPTNEKKHKKGKEEPVNLATMKPGKKEKIRFGQAPRETLPEAANGSSVEDAGALPETASNDQPPNPLEAAPPKREVKTRFSDRAREEKKHKTKKAPQTDTLTPAPPDAAEVADRETQSAPLGLGGDTSPKKKKKKATTTGEKTRLSDVKKHETPAQNPGATPQPTTPQQ